mmetsp:Transcript_25930/g.74911  ORF Transcript_25930/g.74911 Transcript_25930/m.74911 type:complete len:563 (-) Transcript_25930:73-1761(-)
MEPPAPGLPLQLEFALRLPLGHAELGRGGPNGPAMNALDFCPGAGAVFVVNQCQVFSFRLRDIRRAAGEGAGRAAEDGPEPVWEHASPRVINRIRCGAVPAIVPPARSEGAAPDALASAPCEHLPVCAFVDGGGSVYALPTTALKSSTRAMRWINGEGGQRTSTWGIALPRDITASRLPPAGSGALVVSANDHCIRAYSPILRVGDTEHPSPPVPVAAEGEALARSVMCGHAGNLPSLDLSPCGDTVASASLDGSVRLWDLQTGRLVGACHHAGHGWGVCYVPLWSAHVQQLPRRGPARPAEQPALRFGGLLHRGARALHKLWARGRGSRAWCCQRAGPKRPALSLPFVGHKRLRLRATKSLPSVVFEASLMPFLPAEVLLTRIAAASLPLCRAVEIELRRPSRREQLLLHVTDSAVFLRRVERLTEEAKLELPFCGAFAHVAYCPERSLAFISNGLPHSASARRRGVHIVRIERGLNSMKFRLQPMGDLWLEVADRDQRIEGMALARDGDDARLCVLLTSRKLLCYRLSGPNGAESLRAEATGEAANEGDRLLGECSGPPQ